MRRSLNPIFIFIYYVQEWNSITSPDKCFNVCITTTDTIYSSSKFLFSEKEKFLTHSNLLLVIVSYKTLPQTSISLICSKHAFDYFSRFICNTHFCCILCIHHVPTHKLSKREEVPNRDYNFSSIPFY